MQQEQSLTDQLDAGYKNLDSEKTDRAAAEEYSSTVEGYLSVTSGARTNAQEELVTANKNSMQDVADHGTKVAPRKDERKAIAEVSPAQQVCSADSRKNGSEAVSVRSASR